MTNSLVNDEMVEELFPFTAGNVNRQLITPALSLGLLYRLLPSTFSWKMQSRLSLVLINRPQQIIN